MLIRQAMTSPANTAIVPWQDFLGLDGQHRMNTRAPPRGNWCWRFSWEQVPDALAGEIGECWRRTCGCRRVPPLEPAGTTGGARYKVYICIPFTFIGTVVSPINRRRARGGSPDPHTAGGTAIMSQAAPPLSSRVFDPNSEAYLADPIGQCWRTAAAGGWCGTPGRHGS